MMYLTIELLMESLLKAMPLSKMIINLDFKSHTDAIRFSWRGHDFKVDLNGHVNEVQGCMLVGSTICILLEELLKRERYGEDM